MKLLAINGFYPIDGYLSKKVLSPRAWLWTKKKINKLINDIHEPTIITGFGHCANAALTIAITCPWIKEAYVHSPTYTLEKVKHSPSRIAFFRTAGDRSAAFQETMHVYNRLSGICYSQLTLQTLAPTLAPERIGSLFINDWLLKNNQFYNCLQFLPSEFIRC